MIITILIYFYDAVVVVPGCPDLADPENGNIAFTGDALAPFDVGTMATYSCNEGYSLVGDSAVRTCQNGVSIQEDFWSREAPTCQCMLII